MENQPQNLELTENEPADSTVSEVSGDDYNLQSQLEEMKNNWLRAMADLENLRRRSIREKEEALKYGAVNFARDILTISDNVKRALASCPVRDDLMPGVKALLTGVEMIAKEIDNSFDRHGLKKISPLGEKFDPHWHQAMMEVDTLDQEPGTIVQVLQDGYVMHDRLLRPAMVSVAKAAKV